MVAAKNSHFGIHFLHILEGKIGIFTLILSIPQHKELILQMGLLTIDLLLKPKVSHGVQFYLPENMMKYIKSSTCKDIIEVILAQ